MFVEFVNVFLSSVFGLFVLFTFFASCVGIPDSRRMMLLKQHHLRHQQNKYSGQYKLVLPPSYRPPLAHVHGDSGLPIYGRSLVMTGGEKSEAIILYVTSATMFSKKSKTHTHSFRYHGQLRLESGTKWKPHVWRVACCFPSDTRD